MKLTAILLLSACLLASANGKAQPITISEKNSTLEKVFAAIEKQTTYSFVYTDNLLQQARKINVDVKGASLEQVLAICFKDQPYTYTISDRFIVIKQKQETQNAPGVYPEQVSGSIPPIDIRGRIVNENGEPVSASVTVKGTQNGASTNEKGEFEIKGVEENATLIISGVNIEKFEIKIKGKTSLSLTAKTKVAAMEEVVVNKGYYTEKEKTSVSNVGRVTAKDIEKQPVNNVLLALQARVPGLFITQGSGIPGARVKIRIQGENSLNSGNNPIYIVDGVPIEAQMPSTGLGRWILGTYLQSGDDGQAGNPLSYLNPSDIESVEVLKDADATAIYGSRAANGAILITTKKGKVGAMKLDLNIQTGWAKMTRRVDMMNTRQYLDMRYEAFANDGINWTSSSVKANDLKVWDTTRYTNWQDVLLSGTAHYNDINASISGGSTNMRYLVSGTYKKVTTIWPLPTDFADQQAAVHFNINANSNNNKMRMQFSGNYMFDNNQLPSEDMTSHAMLKEPNAPPLLNADGSINWAQDANGTSTLSQGSPNPFVQLYRKYVAKTHNLVSNLKLDYTLMRGLNVGSSFGYNYMQSEDFSPVPLIALTPESRATAQRGASFGNSNLQSWIIEPQASYQTEIKKGSLDVLVGSTFQNRRAIGSNIYAQGQLSDELLGNINSAATITKGGGSGYSVYKYSAVFARAAYNWSDKYILNLTARRDGSTRFGEDNRFHNFGSVGAAWIFTSENFFKSNKSLSEFISFGKLRGSYGTTGNDQIGDYLFQSMYNIYSSPIPYQGAVGLEPDGLPNPKLEWEETQKLQLGLDLVFLHNRLNISATWIRNRSSNQLLSYQLPSPVGFDSYITNFPATVQNMNWEFLLTGKIIQSKNINWTSTINLTIPQNKLIEFPDIENSTYSKRLYVGEPIDVRTNFHWLGVGAGTGQYLFEDKDGHLSVAPDFNEDMISLISTFPKFYGGFNNTITYKNLQFDFLFQFVKQTGNNPVAYWNGSSGIVYPGMFVSGVSNQPVTILNRWQKPGDTHATVAKYSTNEVKYINDSNRSYGDASYIRLKNVSLSMDLPKKWIDKAHFRNCQIFTHVQNLLTITKYKGLDPETQSMVALPPLQVWTVGAKLGL